ncbi:hypothetical protein D6D23_07911 [Aureobasidium pullulans]|nr:hypothetical protein D6D23_07911 [Aureobasidium pullulans]
MAPTIGDIQKRLGLKGAIIRGGEPWKTDEIKDLEKDIRDFYQKYEPYLKREEEYPAEFDDEIIAVLKTHAKKVWPDTLIRSEATTKWLYVAGEIPEYLEDLYHDRHMDKIEPLFRELLNMRVKIYRGNQRHAEIKKQQKAHEIAAATAASPALSDSDLTDFDSSGGTPSLIHVIKFESDESRERLQAIVKGDEFSLRKRKVTQTDSPLDAIKRSKQTATPAEHDYAQHIPTWATTNNDTVRVATPQRYENAPELLVSAASGLTHGFVPVNLPQPQSHEQPRLQEVSDSDEDTSVRGGATLSLHSSDGSCPDLENVAHHQPDTPSEGVTLSSGMQYSLPQGTPLRAQMSGMEKSVPQSLEHPRDVATEGSLPSVIGDQFIPWQKLDNKKRMARRSKVPLRPMMANGDSDSTPELSARGSQSVMHLPSRPSAGVSNSPLPQQDVSMSADVDVNGDDSHSSNSNTEKRKLKRRTNWTAPTSESSKRRSRNTSTATPSAPNDAQQNLTPLSVHQRTYHIPSVDASPRQAAQQYGASPVNAVLDAASPQPRPADSPVTTTGPIIINKAMIPPADMPVSAELITTHFAKTFVKFNLAVNGRSFLKMIKLGDCFDAANLHATINNRFKHALQGQVPTEIAFTIHDNEYAIDSDEGGQVLYDEFLQVLVSGHQSSPVVAEVRL